MLLTMVRSAQLDITEISLAAVAEQYFARLEAMQRLDVEIESSYLVVFAELLELKSRLLLPEPEVDDEADYYLDSPGDDDEYTAEHSLVERLEAYSLVKLAAEWLGEREVVSKARFPRPVSAIYEEEPELDLSLDSLAAAMRKIYIDGRLPRGPVAVARITMSLPDRIAQLWKIFVKQPLTRFRQLLGLNPSRSLIVVTFLALLALAKERKVNLTQENTVGDIVINRQDEPDGTKP